MAPGWVVHKFGGSSLATPALYAAVADILQSRATTRLAVVVSAMRGVTDALIGLVQRAGCRDETYRATLAELRRRQEQAVRELLGEGQDELLAALASDFDNLEALLQAVWLMRSGPDRTLDLVAGHGEIWSARLLAAHLADRGMDATWHDARESLIVRPGELAPVVDREASRARLGTWLAGHPAAVVVLPGFVAGDAEGLPTTLGRNGSDYSAAIFAGLLGAEAIHIWTDVDGVLSADPRHVPDAVLLDRLSYDEAMELAYFGAKVIHPGTMGPAIESGIPIHIRNTFNPEGSGTRIDRSSPTTRPVKGIVTVEDVALVNLEGTGMIGVPGTARRLFGALSEAGVSVILISQGSSEHSICFAIRESHVAGARDVIERAFYAEMRHGQIQTLDVHPDCAILAIVGDSMAGVPGVAGKLFSALAKAGINVRAIAQGSSERNISVVVDRGDATRALRSVHAGFYLSNQTLSIGLIGPGLIGATLLCQIESQLARLRDALKIDLRIRALADSTRMLLSEQRIAADDWRERLAQSATSTDLERLADHVQTDRMPHAVLIDCTADEGVARLHAGWLERGIHVVTPNKLGRAADADYARRLTGPVPRAHYLYEATVGAGLPIIQTLRDLLETGDEVLKIEGVLSGTLSFLFNVFDGGRPFSAILREAREQGFTEPDPRQDLSGMDVARKVVILAREIGLDLNLADVVVEGLVPPGLESGDVATFLERAGALDAPMLGRLQAAQAAGSVLRFVGTIERGGISRVGLRPFPVEHAFSRIRGADNIVQFTTRRYHDHPLIVQGPGAGPEVTAGGVFSDLLRLAAYLGTPPLRGS